MEFCPRTLAGVMQDGPLQEEDAWQVLRGILAGESENLGSSLVTVAEREEAHRKPAISHTARRQTVRGPV